MSKKNKKKNQFERKDKSPVVPQNSKIRNELNLHIRELTEKQKKFLDIALNKDTKVMFISGPAGTSKTFMSVLASLQLLNQKKMSDILYIRSAVESADSKIGFLPGDGHEKLAPYIQPLLDKLSEFLPKGEVDALQKDGRLDSIPIGFLRGLNWNAKCIIVDESQNITMKELITIITRVGEFSKVFILGDPDQSDIGAKSGFTKMISVFDDEESQKNGVFTFKFDEDDIVRSGLVKFIIKKIKKLY
jgi:phosphate starvation-inducible PhoH-like protein